MRRSPASSFNSVLLRQIICHPLPAWLLQTGRGHGEGYRACTMGAKALRGVGKSASRAERHQEVKEVLRVGGTRVVVVRAAVEEIVQEVEVVLRVQSPVAVPVGAAPADVWNPVAIGIHQ